VTEYDTVKRKLLCWVQKIYT